MINSFLSALRGTRLIVVALALAVSVAAGANDCVPVGSVLLPDDKAQIGVPALIKSVADDRIVLLGEHHDNMEHHRWQLQMIAGLHTLDPRMVLGFEMFPRASQPVLDRWVAGELDESEFLEQVNWQEYWNFDASLYLPLFHFARMNRIPMYALNVERSLIRAVGQQGWDNLGDTAREGVSRPAAPSDGYRELLASVFMQHGERHGAGSAEETVARAMAMPGFSRFVESQQVWDRAMAEAIAGALERDAATRVVAVLGSGHMMYRFGVPEQLADLGMPRPAVLIPWDPEFECDYIRKGFADAVIGLAAHRFSEQQQDQQRPRLGVYLAPGDGGVAIKDVMSDSIAAELGLQAGDLVVRMAGQEITEVNQVIDIVSRTQPGTWLPFSIQRSGKTLDFVAKFPAGAISR